MPGCNVVHRRTIGVFGLRIKYLSFPIYQPQKYKDSIVFVLHHRSRLSWPIEAVGNGKESTSSWIVYGSGQPSTQVELMWAFKYHI